jgi:hypothetical protein
VLQRQRGAVAVVVEAGVARERDKPSPMARIKRRILRTMPQPPRSVLAEPAADEQW